MGQSGGRAADHPGGGRAEAGWPWRPAASRGAAGRRPWLPAARTDPMQTLMSVYYIISNVSKDD